MPRIAIGLEYDGTDFVGWQIQREGRSVEGALAAAVQAVADEPIVIHGAGRTDAGVHADQQVAHFDTDGAAHRAAVAARDQLAPAARRRDPLGSRGAAGLRRAPLGDPPPLPLFDSPAGDAARARALARLVDPRAARRGGDDRRVAALARRARLLRVSRRRLSGEVADAAAAWPCGSRVRRRADGVSWAIEFTANAFLQHMVRNLVGTLVEIGRGDLAPARPHGDAREPRPHAGRRRGAAGRTHARRRVVSGALRLADRRRRIR